MSSVSGDGVTGPLAPFASGFSLALVEQGYRLGSAAAQLQLMAFASRCWPPVRWGLVI